MCFVGIVHISNILFVRLLPTLFLIVYEKFATHELARMLPTVSKELEDFGNHIVSIRWNNIK